MLKHYLGFVILATLVAANDPKLRIVNGQQIGSIINGKVHNPGTFPYVVYLRIIEYSTKYIPQVNRHVSFVRSLRCGGSIIRPDLILTAAHCVKDAAPQNVTAFSGIVHLAKEQPSAQFIRGRRIISHEQYQKFWKNDIALVFLVESFDITDYVKTIKLGIPENYQSGMNVTAVGWGRDENGESTSWLYRGDFVVGDRLTCANNVVGFDKYEKLLCGIDLHLSQKVCSGDSGGPLVSNGILVGISVGVIEPNKEGVPQNGSCDPNYPAVFTNVSYYRNWIDRNIAYDNQYYRLL